MLGSGEVRGSSILLGLKSIHAKAAMAKGKGPGLPVTLLTIYKQDKSQSPGKGNTSLLESGIGVLSSVSSYL